MKLLAAVLAFVLLALPAAAQIPGGVVQSGVVTAGHCTSWTRTGVIQDAGSACGAASSVTVASTTISGGTLSGILWNNAGVLAAGPALTNTAGDLIAVSGQSLAIGSASVNTGVKLVQNGGAFRCKISDGSADCAYQGLNFVAIGGTFGGASGSTLNLTVDGTAKFLNAATTSGVVLNFATDGRFAVFARDGTTAGVFASGTNVGVSCGTGILNPVTAVVTNGIITHC